MFTNDVLSVFVPTFIFVSLTPGMCMTLSMTLGMTIGVKRSLHFMWGELLGVGAVAFLSVAGMAAVMLKWPAVFIIFKLLGGAYLLFLGIQMWQSRGKLSIQSQDSVDLNINPLELASQGFMTAVVNPKGWAFLIALLPPFIQADEPFLPQTVVLILLILLIEFSALIIYASGGKSLRKLLNKNSNVRLINRLAGTLMIGIAFRLALG